MELLLVRHGQASFYGASYDELSVLGLSQARLLGEHWGRSGLRPARAWVGPRRRHTQTYAAAAEAYETYGERFPAAEPLPALDEHAGITVAKTKLGHADPDSGALHGPAGPGSDQEAERAKSALLVSYLGAIREWARGEIDSAGCESWAAFRDRVRGALERMTAVPSDGPVVAFTSGGVVCAAVGWMLGLDEDRVIDLHTVVRNTSITAIGHSGRYRHLVTFNETPHLPAANLVTLI